MGDQRDLTQSPESGEGAEPVVVEASAAGVYAYAGIAASADIVTNTDKWFGQNLKAVREERGLSQSALAAQMTELGFSWHPMTTKRIESGEQPVKLAEARALVQILATPLSELLLDPVARLDIEVRRVLDGLRDAEARYTAAQVEYTEHFQRLLQLQQDPDLTEQTRQAIGEWVEESVDANLERGARVEDAHRKARGMDRPSILESKIRGAALEIRILQKKLRELREEGGHGVEPDPRIVPGAVVVHDEHGPGVVADLGVEGAHDFEGVWVAFASAPNTHVAMGAMNKRFVPVSTLTVIDEADADA